MFMKHLNRQINHWLYAAERLAEIKNLASETAWNGLQVNTQNIIKNYLEKNIITLVAKGKHLQKQIINSTNNRLLQQEMQKAIYRYKNDYSRIETTIHFYTDAINTRTQQSVAEILSGCDELCRLCMEKFLIPQSKSVPPTITYLDKGLGAAIMKAGLKLWDGSTSPVALIKITFHNLLRPTALLHESGHQIAHMLGWNKELSTTLYNALGKKNIQVAKAFSSWSSEIAADAIALCTTGYASAAALHDVVDGEGEAVFSYNEMDPHPIAYLRVLLNCTMCEYLFGDGAWQELAKDWMEKHPLKNASEEANKIIEDALPLLGVIATTILQTKQLAFGNKSIAEYVDVSLVHPKQLSTIEQKLKADPILKPKQFGLQYVALTGFKIATGVYPIKEELNKMESFLQSISKTNKQYYSLN
jgi:hypothetical protein